MLQQELFTNIFGETSPDKKAGMLQDVTQEFPYFTIAQYYLVKETDQSDTNYKKIAGRAALHFNDPFYLNYLLSKKKENLDTDITNVEPLVLDTEEQKTYISNKEETKPAKQAKIQNPAEDMIFEPLFATDYFASQGIKLGDEVKPDDKLGKQLKSFTDWLKTMKKIHEQNLQGGNDQIDLAVQNIAEKSNKEEVVITETMAEVYIGQGKLNKAREIYHKLSLLNPSKSAYFAAKTESLKEK